jgi:hypothetical protein
MRPSFRVLASAALVIAAVAPGAARAGDDLIACPTKGQISVRKDGWTRINAPQPDIGEGDRKVTAFTTAPRAANRVYVTNGTAIRYSADGGCHWNFLQRSSNVMVPGGQHRPDIFTHLTSPNDSQLWAASYDDAAGEAHPHIHLFQKLADDGTDAEHSMVENGLPAVGRPIDLISSSSGSDTVYLLVEEPPDATSGDPLTPVRRIYTTVTPTEPPQLAAIGVIWQQVKTPAGLGLIQGMAYGPGRSLWVWSKDKVALTAGAEVDPPVWVQPKIPAGTIAGLDVSSGGDALVVLQTEQGRVTATLDETGHPLKGISVPVLPTSMTHGNRPQTRVVSSPKGTWGFDPNARRWVDITPTGVGGLHDLEIANGRTLRYVAGHTADAIYRFDLYEGESFLAGGSTGTVGKWPHLPHSTIFEPYVDPASVTVTVKPDQIKDVPATFGMPAAVNPLDVYFLVDTTSSMQATITSLRTDIGLIARRLRDELGREACFGVGQFKDFDEGTAALDATAVFQTMQRVVCEDPSLPLVSAALAKLQAGGGGDDPEAATVALTQMMTGDGQPKPPVLAGQKAGFRASSYKVVVLITDAWFKQESGYPTIPDTATKLSADGVKVVSVQVLDDLPPDRARNDMTDLAIGTDSVAPAGGVDCDGDKKISQYDLAPGEPLICETDGTQPNIGPVIVSLLLGVEDPGTLAVNIADPMHAIRPPIKGKTSDIFNLKREARLGFAMPVSCTKAQLGMDLPITLTPSVRALPLGIHGRVTVLCRDTIPVPPVPKVPPKVVQPEPVLPAPPRPPAAIALVPPPNPPVQPVSNINVNAGFSQQEEQQFQLATVAQGAEEEENEDVELAMVGLERDTSTTPVAAFLTGAMVLSAAAALAHRRRLQRSTRPVYVRTG